MRFVAAAKVGHTYNVTYSGAYPTSVDHKISLRTYDVGRSSDFVVFKYIYGVP